MTEKARSFISDREKIFVKGLAKNAEANGTELFFRGTGSLPGFKPPKDSLAGKRSQNNYRFSVDDIGKTVDWMNKNLEFNFVSVEANIDELEIKLIQKNIPVLNAKHNPQKSEKLAQLRKTCRDFALNKCDEKERSIK